MQENSKKWHQNQTEAGQGQTDFRTKTIATTMMADIFSANDHDGSVMYFLALSDRG